MTLVTVDGFSESKPMEFIQAEAILTHNSPAAIDINNDADPENLRDRLQHLHTIRIHFPASSDGRGFSLARQLRQMGYTGRLRAFGPLISDQFRYALECGFDEVEIDDDLAQRQPETHWKDFGQSGYRKKLSTPRAPETRDENLYYETVTEVHHYNDNLFRFRITRPDGLRFTAGEFVMLGLENNGSRTMRAYSIASASWDETLEFYSIKVPDGKLTKKLKWIRVGDTIVLNKKSTGSLVLDTLIPGKRLFMHATGTGIAPYTSLIQEPELYEKYDQIILTHTCRYEDELSFGRELVNSVVTDSPLAEAATEKLIYRASTTREPGNTRARITDEIKSGSLYDELGIAGLNPEQDRIMICGSKPVNVDMKALFLDAGFTQGSLNNPGSFVWERAFVG